MKFWVVKTWLHLHASWHNQLGHNEMMLADDNHVGISPAMKNKVQACMIIHMCTYAFHEIMSSKDMTAFDCSLK